ncbi:MAG: hypothetical protein ACFFG0_53230 [Candidatus Thorarchaeota archaeon]
MRGVKLFNFRRKKEEAISQIRLFFSEELQDVDIETDFTQNRLFEFCIILNLLREDVKKIVLDNLQKKNPMGYAMVFSVVKSMSHIKGGKIEWSEHILDFSHDEEDFIENNEENNMFITPFGYLINNEGNPIKDLKFWVGDTNFDLTVTGDIISKISGVDLYRQISKYKFAIMIGKLFDEEVVKDNIERCLCDNTDAEGEINFGFGETQILEDKISELKEQSNFWVCYMFPNGKIESRTFDNEFEYKENLEYYTTLAQMSEGLLLTHEDQQ